MISKKRHLNYTESTSYVITNEYCFVALRPKSTAMVMVGWSVHLTALFPGQAVNQYFVHILSLVTDNNFS